MTACFRCGTTTAERYICRECATNQGRARDAEFLEHYQPTIVQVLAIKRLAGLLRAEGINPRPAEPEDPDALELNEQRFLLALHGEEATVPEGSTSHHEDQGIS
jgi:hypothetical protein